MTPFCPSQANEAAEREEQDRERFLEELEEDPELRKAVNLYADPEVDASLMAALREKLQVDPEYGSDSDIGDVGLEELVENLAIADAAMGDADDA